MSHTILIVDDSPTVREILKIYLTQRTVEFVEANDGERALQLSKLMPISLVIADIKMPGMDGIEFTRQMRASSDAKISRLPIILLTGEHEVDLRTRAMAAGATAFLYKPIAGPKLREVVEPYLNSK